MRCSTGDRTQGPTPGSGVIGARARGGMNMAAGGVVYTPPPRTAGSRAPREREIDIEWLVGFGTRRGLRAGAHGKGCGQQVGSSGDAQPEARESSRWGAGWHQDKAPLPLESVSCVGNLQQNRTSRQSRPDGNSPGENRVRIVSWTLAGAGPLPGGPGSASASVPATRGVECSQDMFRSP